MPEPLNVATDLPVTSTIPKIGRPSLRSPQLAEQICTLISNGHTLKRTISGDFGFTCSWNFICDWLKADAEFNRLYAQARARLADWLADDIVELAESATQENHAAIRVQIDTKKWIASKVLPKVYGDQPAQISVNNVNNVLVVSEDQRQQLIQTRREMGVKRQQLGNGSTVQGEPTP